MRLRDLCQADHLGLKVLSGHDLLDQVGGGDATDPAIEQIVAAEHLQSQVVGLAQVPQAHICRLAAAQTGQDSRRHAASQNSHS